MNNSNSNTYCDWYIAAAEVTNYSYAYIVTPLLFIFGFTTQSLMLITFYRQAKKESGYWYQLFLAACDITVVVTRTFYVVTFDILFNGKVTWCISNYGCMWITMHLSIPVANMFVTTSLLLAVAMSADRVFALGKPFLYKNINHKFHRVVACITCIIIGIGSSIFDIFRYDPGLGPDGFYTRKRNEAFTSSLVAIALSHLRDAIRGVGTLVLIICNVVMLVLYHKYTRKIASIGSSSEVKKRREKQKVLAILAISESVCNTLSMAALLTYYSLYYMYPNFINCENRFVSGLQDMITDFSAVADCFVVFVVSKTFRSMIFESVPCLKRIFACFLSVSDTNMPTGVTNHK